MRQGSCISVVVNPGRACTTKDDCNSDLTINMHEMRDLRGLPLSPNVAASSSTLFFTMLILRGQSAKQNVSRTCSCIIIDWVAASLSLSNIRALAQMRLLHGPLSRCSCYRDICARNSGGNLGVFPPTP